MFALPLLFQPQRYPAEFTPCALNPLLRLLLLLLVYLGQSCAHAAVDTLQNRDRHIEIALQVQAG
jgi:hypothetical protein